MTANSIAGQEFFACDYASDARIAALVGPGAPFEVVDRECAGVPLRCFANAPRTLVDVYRAAAAHDARDCLVHENERLTFGEVRREAAVVAMHLRRDHGVGPGDRVAVAMRNLPEFVPIMWATALLGAILVPLNAWWRGPELERALEEAEATVVFVDDERLQRLTGVGARGGSRVLVGVRTGARHLDFADLAAGEVMSPEQFADPDPGDVAFVLYTSGTTGRPKGVVITHRGTIANVMNMMFMRARDMVLTGRLPSGSGGPAAGLLTTPYFHVGGLASAVGAGLTGVTTVLLHKWDVDEAMRLVEREHVTGMGGVPMIAREMLEHPRAAALAGQVTSFSVGAASVPPELPRLAREVLGESVQIFNGYGATETTSGVVSNVGADYEEHPDSVGRLNPTTELRIESADGRLLPPGEVGELSVRSPQTALGYWRNPEATAESFCDGWFRTGDLGSIDEDGFVYVVDRVKDVVIRGGENVYCAEVEAVLFEHSTVLDVAVVAIPDDAMGERVCAVVVPRAGATPVLEELRAFAAERLAAFKCPEALVVAGEVPRTATGKIAKNQLRQMVTDDPGRVECR
ncbi:class I adenylate-forming enzyme family protein [Rhodococcus gannanensis]|uniref:Class I adenylate-forming enzyme family protein n=1 Tax=Rhodococcus gannanensis TaxID=1960308 RepID=A0ABW4P6A7_9NOCA